jgi:glycosyltransferase involved in cell wall biosynthesis
MPRTRAQLRVVHLAWAPLPYYTPILNEIAVHVDLHVIYLGRRAPLTTFSDDWGVAPKFAHEYARTLTVHLAQLDFRAQFALGISRRLMRLNPDVVLVYGWHPTMYEALAWCRHRGVPAVMWSETTRTSGLARGKLSNAVRSLAVRMCDAYVTSGSLAARFLHELGADPRRVVASVLPTAMSVPSEQDFMAGQERGDDRRGVQFLFVGRLIERKRPLQVLRAFARVKSEVPDASLMVVGDGPLAERMRHNAHPLGSAVTMTGNLEGAALRAAYLQCDVLVLPAVREVWGLVVNEALLHGLLVIASDEVGSARDLVTPDRGWLVTDGDEVGLQASMLQAARAGPRAPAERMALSQAIRKHDPTAFAADAVRAIRLTASPE